MNLERLDLAALRLAERRGWFPTEAELAEVQLGRDEFGLRLRRLKEAAVIKGFHATLVVPPFLGGDWVWGAVLIQTGRPLNVASALMAKLPFVTEAIFNSGLPEKLGPSLALLFYSRDFDNQARFIQSVTGIEYHEVYRVAEYSFPMAMPLSSDERLLVRHVVKNPDADIAAIGSALGRDEKWVRVKLDRLLWNEMNRSGVLRVQPELDWSRVENFGHFHFLVETGHRPEQLVRLTSEQGLSLVLGGRMFRSRYVQMEADVWGVSELMDRVTFLSQIAGVRVAGVVWNRQATVNTGWVAKLVE
uniref:Lrp/AsnC family transcriptional regulator n=1 Tax=candidate division WOR-3 bacterium TaxID=2052148 RepID=A0A7C4GBM7_UNCW3